MKACAQSRDATRVWGFPEEDEPGVLMVQVGRGEEEFQAQEGLAASRTEKVWKGHRGGGCAGVKRT